MKQYKSKLLLYQLYIKEGKSTVEISKIFKCSKSTINNWLIKYNIQIRTLSESCKGKKHQARPLNERFWEKVEIREKNKCWNWTGGCSLNGYGQISKNGKQKSAHRISWELHYGKISDGMHVCHKCDNKQCVNPYHLFLGTHQDNMVDRDKKGRQSIGENRPTSKLTKKQVLEIIDQYTGKRGEQIKLAKKYGVSKTAIGHVIHNRTWRHLLNNYG